MILPDSETFMKMLKNPEQVITGLLKDLDSCQKNMSAFQKLEELYESGEDVSTEKALKACAKSLRHTNELNLKLIMLLIVYVSGGNYQSDTAQVLNKLGRGEEALQEMFKRKLSGK